MPTAISYKPLKPRSVPFREKTTLFMVIIPQECNAYKYKSSHTNFISTLQYWLQTET